MIKISPSILSADFAKLGQQIKKLEKSSADMIHIDVMDGHFVPNLTIGPVVIESIRSYTNLPFDVHLMISNPEKYLHNFISAGSDILTIHYETSIDLKYCLKTIRSFNKLAGISIKPSTPISAVKDLINDIDLLLIMSVEPGFSGQTFQSNMLEKIKNSANMISASKKSVMISVDGGINDTNCNLCKKAGANILVSGNFIFKSKNWKKQIEKLKL